MRFIHRPALRVLVTATLYAVALALIYFAWQALVAILFALLFGYVLEPLVKLVEGRLWHSRMGAIAVSYLALFAVVAGFVLLLGARVEGELRVVETKGPGYWQQIQSGQLPPEMARQGGFAGKIEQRLVRWVSHNRERIGQWTQRAARYAVFLGVAGFWVVVVLILGVFVLKDKDRWMAALSSRPEESGTRRRLRQMLVEIDAALSRYVWAQVILSVIGFAAFAIVLPVLHLPFALLLALVQGLLEFIFVFGPLASGTLILATALFSGHSLLGTLAFLVGWRIVQDYVNTPLLFGKRLEMHPLVIVVVLMVGWSIGNVIGMFLAVPVAAAAQIAWETWNASRRPVKELAELLDDRQAA